MKKKQKKTGGFNFSLFTKDEICGRNTQLQEYMGLHKTFFMQNKSHTVYIIYHEITFSAMFYVGFNNIQITVGFLTWLDAIVLTQITFLKTVFNTKEIIKKISVGLVTNHSVLHYSIIPVLKS